MIQRLLIARLAFLSILLPAPSMAQSPTVPVGDPAFEDYRRQFATCDASGIFEKVQLPIKNDKGKTIWFDCSDSSNLVRLESVKAKGDAPAAVIFESKIAHDDDGSKQSCAPYADIGIRPIMPISGLCRADVCS